MLHNTLKALVDLLLPRNCIVCGEKLTPQEEHLCRWCRDDMPLTRFWQMRRNRMADKMNERIQAELNSFESYAYAAALFFFNDEGNYKKIPYRVKYEGDIRAGRHFGTVLGRYLVTAEWFQDIDMIIPVPLHRKRRWKRGYNQAEIIAEGISQALGVPVRTDILKRLRNTQTQINLDVEDKAANVAGAFIASATSPFRHILLVDDVFTTGSTLTACYFALREIFPSEVRISVATLGFVGRF